MIELATMKDLQAVKKLQYTQLKKGADIDTLEPGGYFVNWHDNTNGKYPFTGTGILIQFDSITKFQIAMYDSSSGIFFVRSRPENREGWGAWYKNESHSHPNKDVLDNITKTIETEATERQSADTELRDKIDTETTARESADISNKLKNLADYAIDYNANDKIAIANNNQSHDEFLLGMYIFSPEHDVNRVILESAERTEAVYEGELLSENTYIIDFRAEGSKLIHTFDAANKHNWFFGNASASGDAPSLNDLREWIDENQRTMHSEDARIEGVINSVAENAQKLVNAEKTAREDADVESKLKNLAEYELSYDTNSNGYTIFYAQRKPDNIPLGMYIFSPEQNVDYVILLSPDDELELATYDGKLLAGNAYIIDFQPGESKLIGVLDAGSKHDWFFDTGNSRDDSLTLGEVEDIINNMTLKWQPLNGEDGETVIEDVKAYTYTLPEKCKGIIVDISVPKAENWPGGSFSILDDKSVTVGQGYTWKKDGATDHKKTLRVCCKPENGYYDMFYNHNAGTHEQMLTQYRTSTIYVNKVADTSCLRKFTTANVLPVGTTIKIWGLIEE